MYSFTITINGEEVTAYACYPFSGELTLDRSLDQAFIDLKATPRSAPYPPFSEVVITPNIGEPTTFVIASDEVDTIIKTGLSNHRILLCEETKKLERIICPGKTFVQPLVKNYEQTQAPPQSLSGGFKTLSDLFIEYTWLSNSVNGTGVYFDQEADWTTRVPSTIDGVYSGSSALPSMLTVFNFGLTGNNRLAGYAIILVDALSGELVDSARGVKLTYANTDPTVTLPSRVGSYYVYYIANFGAGEAYQYAAAYAVSVANTNATQKPPLYITDVTNQLLEIAEPIRQGDTPRYTLDAATATKYAATPCAELNLPNGATLREDLDEIAGIVHCITRLKNGKIYFDPVGDPNLADTAKLGDPASVRSSANLEKYATHLDSFVDNLMNAQDPQQGAISDPFIGIYKTCRALVSNTDARVTVSNCRINTIFPIEKIEKVEVLYNGNAYDITAFIYEKSEYDLLETNSGVYPYAKAYALYYTQGQRDIDGLTHRAETTLFPSLQNYAIANILSVVTGQNLDWKSDLFGTAILDYAFNVTYISAVRGRVRAAKKDINDIVSPSALAFNQGAPRLSSVNFGERLKGETAMLSEPEVHLCFKTSDLSAVMDSVGRLYEWDGDRYYISKVTYKVWSGYIIAEMNLSRNFNQLGRFVSINNAFRQFEIDDNSQEECIVYEDYAVFTTAEPTTVPNDSLSSGDNLLSAIRNVIDDVNVTSGNHQVTLCSARTIDGSSNKIADVLLPVQAIALGNSLLFNFRFSDNYSAGEFLQPQGGYKLTRATPYGDPLYGEARYVGFQLCSDPAYVSGADRIAIGNRIPLETSDITRTVQATTTFSRPLIVNKSSRDIPNITYQLHHVTDSGLIFGTALTNRNRLVTYYEQNICVLFKLPFEINPISPPIPVGYSSAGGNYYNYTFAVNGQNYTVKGVEIVTDPPTNHTLKIPVTRTISNAGGNLSQTAYKSWAIFRGKSGGAPEFVLGKNGEIEDVYIYLRHNLT